ncbi:terminase small subunit [Pontibacter sp. SGAir0037]|uniref:terminase small subunit n=1 Tax=Pontibacter sp. SGAir0037 TaxID=2571030 RepID=UPI0010CD035F|nr:terminase small subunit [Pontibacter sp. SGAir0037]QCR23782.1 hypothetical protein C1N53_16450 [Pontibacter sp. SGAir0037]
MEEQKKLTAKEQRFVEEYCKDCNATQAAIRSGYSQKSAYSIGWENLRKPEISEAVKARLNELALPAEETTKLITDIAKGDIKNYYTITEVEESTRIKVPLSHVIESIREEMAFEEEYAARAELDEDELKSHKAAQAKRRRQIIRHHLELERDPQATGYVQGPPQKVKRTELDMVKLIEDKQAGRIKAIIPSEHGLKVELYPADAALDKLARMHGLYEKDNNQNISLTWHEERTYEANDQAD